jgi:hypothetical protein
MMHKTVIFTTSFPRNLSQRKPGAAIQKERLDSGSSPE